MSREIQKITEHSFDVLEALGYGLGLRLGRMQHWSTALVRQAIHEWIQRRLDDPATSEMVVAILADPRPTYQEAARARPGYRRALEAAMIRHDAQDMERRRAIQEDEQQRLRAAVESGKAALLDSEREKRRTRKPKSQ